MSEGVDGGAGTLDLLDIDVPADLSVLRTMLRISNAVLCANFFDEVLEVVAEQALDALGAASVSISRWERDNSALRTLINVGELAPGELRWPDDDLYPILDDPDVTGLLQYGRPYVHAIDDLDVSDSVVDYLRRVGKESEVAVPVTHDDSMWGEIWATGVAGRRFGHDDIQLLQAIAAYTAVAIGRGELFTTAWRHARQDPLTELANRRALEERFDEINWYTRKPTLLVGDLDGFKDVNDRDGHDAGDALLCDVAAVLRDTVVGFDHAMAARLGGDEFCVLLPDGTLADAERLAHTVSNAITAALGDRVTMTWGAAAANPEVRSGPTLLAAADSALRNAKTLGPHRFSGGLTGPRIVPGSQDRRSGALGRRGSDSLVSRVAVLLDENRPMPVVAALEILAVQVQNTLDAAGWSVSVTTDDRTGLVTARGAEGIKHPASGMWVLRDGGSGEVYPLKDYPSTARALATGSSFVAAVGLDGSDPAETALLDRLGYRAVLAVGVTDAERGYLVEIFSALDHTKLTDIATTVQVLAHYCVSVAQTEPPS